jgi:hypothetical protein
MKKSKLVARFSMLILLLAFTANEVKASQVPFLSLTPITGSSSVQVVVNGADPNSEAFLYYPTTSSVASTDLGQTNVNGYLSTTTNSSLLGIAVNAPVYVRTNGIQSQIISWPNYSSAGGLPLSQTNITLSVGQSLVVTASVSGQISMPNNTNPSVAGIGISGNQITVNGFAPGSTSVNLCAAYLGCNTLFITVQSAITTSNTNISLGQSQVNLTVGQHLSVPITGNGAYTVTDNSARSSVTANINGNNVDLTGVAFGGANIKICQISGQCANLYAYVSPNNGTAAVQVSQAPLLSSFSANSNNAGGGFLNASSMLTLTVATNQDVNTPIITLNGITLPVSGSNSGPYTATYTLTGNEVKPIAVGITFKNSANNSGQAYFSLSNSASNIVAAATGLPNNNTASAVDAVNSSSIKSVEFTRLLSIGSRGNDVIALQKRLTTDGFYSGPINGSFGPLTSAGLKKYQTKHGLPAAGVVGPATLKLLNQGL